MHAAQWRWVEPVAERTVPLSSPKNTVDSSQDRAGVPEMVAFTEKFHSGTLLPAKLAASSAKKALLLLPTYTIPCVEPDNGTGRDYTCSKSDHSINPGHVYCSNSERGPLCRRQGPRFTLLSTHGDDRTKKSPSVQNEPVMFPVAASSRNTTESSSDPTYKDTEPSSAGRLTAMLEYMAQLTCCIHRTAPVEALTAKMGPVSFPEAMYTTPLARAGDDCELDRRKSCAGHIAHVVRKKKKTSVTSRLQLQLTSRIHGHGRGRQP